MGALIEESLKRKEETALVIFPEMNMLRDALQQETQKRIALEKEVEVLRNVQT